MATLRVLPGVLLAAVSAGVLLPVASPWAAADPRPGAEPGWQETSPGFMLPDDPLLREQWWLFNFGQEIGGLEGGNADADVRAPEAWAVTRGEGVVVAVLDFGVDYEHADLEGRIWTNPGETGRGREDNGVDDDGNGYVDDWRGWDFVDHDNDAMDEVGHGTEVAGMIAASGGDGFGITGIAPESTVMVLRVGDTGVDQNLTPAAIDYAAAMGARVVVQSYRTDPSGLFDQSQAETAAMKRHQELLFLAGSGNDGIDYGDFAGRAGGLKPCNNPTVPNLICVGGTNDADEAAEFSTFGAGRVHVAAPADRLLVLERPREVIEVEEFDDPGGWAPAPKDMGAFWTPKGPEAGFAFEEDERAGDGAVLHVTHEPGANVESLSVLRRVAKVDLTGREGCTAELVASGTMSDLVTFGVGAFREEDQHLNAFGGQLSIGDNELADYATRYGAFSFPLAGDGPVEIFVQLATSAFGENHVDLRLDGITVSCWNPAHGERDYAYWAGTSFAAPLVAGAAALVLAAYPDLDPRQVKQSILDSAVPLPSLEGKVSTGGRLDAYGALLAAAELTGRGGAGGTAYDGPVRDGADAPSVDFQKLLDHVIPEAGAELGVPTGRGEPDTFLLGGQQEGDDGQADGDNNSDFWRNVLEWVLVALAVILVTILLYWILTRQKVRAALAAFAAAVKRLWDKLFGKKPPVPDPRLAKIKELVDQIKTTPGMTEKARAAYRQVMGKEWDGTAEALSKMNYNQYQRFMELLNRGMG